LNRKLREFGWEEEFLDEAALRQVMQAYLNETNPLKAEKLRRIVSEQFVCNMKKTRNGGSNSLLTSSQLQAARAVKKCEN